MAFGCSAQPKDQALSNIIMLYINSKNTVLPMLAFVINPRRACAGRVTVVAVCVWQKTVAFCLKLFRCRDRALPRLMALHRVGHFSYREHACALCIRKSDKDGTHFDASYAIAVSSPGVLALR